VTLVAIDPAIGYLSGSQSSPGLALLAVLVLLGSRWILLVTR
jgi:hypothetical protein